MSVSLKQSLLAAIGAKGPSSSDYDLNDVGNLRPDTTRDAAVLIAITNRPEPRVILTKRSARLRYHPGQVAFAGGRCDPEDTDPIHTALREAHEEIALPSGLVDVLGALPPHATVTGYHVTPIIGLLNSKFEPKANPAEVAEVFDVPLTFLMDQANYQILGRRWQGHMRYYYAIPYGPYYIWGASARILRGLADRMAYGTDLS